MSVATCSDQLDSQDESQPDKWELAKALYFSGLSNKEIADKVNVSVPALWQRIVRGGWNTLRTNSSAIVSVTTQTKTGQTEGMTKEQGDKVQNASAKVRQTVSGELETISSDVAALKLSKGVKGLEQRLNLLKTLTDVSKTVFGWSESSTTTAISVHMLSTAQVVREQPAIDVTTVEPAIADTTPAGTGAIVPDVPGAVQER